MKTYYGVVMGSDLIRVTEEFEKAMKTNSILKESEVYSVSEKNKLSAIKYFCSRFGLMAAEGC